MTNAEKFKEVFGEELSGDEYIIKCNGTGEDCERCGYGVHGMFVCHREDWMNEEYTGKGTDGHF